MERLKLRYNDCKNALKTLKDITVLKLDELTR